MRNSGFTLIELIVAISLMGIVLSIAVFSFNDVIWRNQVGTATNDFVGVLNFARSAAVTRGQTVTVCRSSDAHESDDAAAPLPTCSTSAGSGWETGWIVFVDADGNGVRDADEVLLRAVSRIDNGVTIIGNGSVANNLRYAASGFLVSGVNNATVTVSNGSRSINVVISRSGRVRSGPTPP